MWSAKSSLSWKRLELTIAVLNTLEVVNVCVLGVESSMMGTFNTPNHLVNYLTY